MLSALPPVFDDGDLEQGGDVEDPYEEGDCHPVQLREQEDEGGGEGARHGEQEELNTHYCHGWGVMGSENRYLLLRMQMYIYNPRFFFQSILKYLVLSGGLTGPTTRKYVSD